MKFFGRLRLVLVVCALLSISSAQNPLGFQIRTDHSGQLFFPSMDPPLSMRWSTFLAGTTSYPIIVGGKVFAIAGGSPSTLYALDAQTGHTLWAQPSPQGYGAWVGAAYENGVLFVVPFTAGNGFGAMFAFSAADGHQIWVTALPGQYDFTSAPTARNGIVYTAGAESGGTVYAVRESDGTVLWTGSVENGDSSAPAVTGDGVYVSYACPQTYKFAPNTGALLWHYSGPCEGGGGASAAVYQGLVYVRDLFSPDYPTDGITLNASTGFYVGGFNSKYSPAFWQNTAFYTETSSLTAVDLTSSQVLWRALPGGQDSYSCAPIVVNGVVFAGTANGNVFGYAFDTGSQLFSANLGQGISCSEGSRLPLAGMNASDGLLVVPAGSYVFAFQYDHFGAWQFASVNPCRLVDTRQGNNPIQGGTSRDFTVPQLGGCNVPGSAAAYSLNVTVVPHTTLGYLTIWPTGEEQPYVSTMNSLDGRTKANAAIVPAGLNDSISVYVTDTSDVILDIDGYFAPPPQGTLQFYPVAPCRVVDTRDSHQPMGLGPPSLGDMETRDLPALTSPCLQGISNPQAYSFNVTVVPVNGQPLGYLTVWPSDQQQPYVSTLNNPTATVVANGAIVPAAVSNGNIKVFAYNSTDVIMDINGYFAAPGQGGYSFYPAAPCRVLDTRQVGNGQPFSGELTVNVVGSPCAPPSTAQAYVFNATVVPSGFLDYLTLWPDGQTQPFASTLNAYDGLITSNLAIIPTTNGSIDAYASQLTQLILDISGYFAP